MPARVARFLPAWTDVQFEWSLSWREPEDDVVPAARRLVTPGQLALAWLLAQGPDVVPIPGTRSRKRIAKNTSAAAVTLSTEDLAALDAALPREGWQGSAEDATETLTELTAAIPDYPPSNPGPDQSRSKAALTQRGARNSA